MLISSSILGASVLGAMGDPIRARILELLAETDLAAGDIASHFEVSRPAVSRHLRILRDAGLVDFQEQGQNRVYRLAPERVDAVACWTRQLCRRWQARLDALGAHLDDLEQQEKELA